MTPEAARELALALPDAVEQDHQWQAVVPRRRQDLRDALGRYVCEPVHWGKRLAAVGVRLPAADGELLAELLEDAWETKLSGQRP